MPYSFYQALLIFIPLVAMVWLIKKYTRPNVYNNVKKDIESRLFAESPTFVVEDLMLDKTSGGFYSFRVEGLVMGLTENNLESRIVEGTHSGQVFLEWNYKKPDDLDLKRQYAEFYPQK